MHKAIFAAALVAAAPGAALAQAKSVIITGAQVQQVLSHGGGAIDQSIRTVDMGDYQMGVAVIHRGPTTSSGGGSGMRQQATTQPCGLAAVPAGAKQGPAAVSHDDTAETYFITSGSGTLVTGGQIAAGTRWAADSDVVTTLNGPSCSGKLVGDFSSREMKAGDIAVIPAGEPHGWTGITTEITYLSFRPDPKKVLPRDYVNPALR